VASDIRHYVRVTDESAKGERPLTGIVTIEWVDGGNADPRPFNLGFTLRTEPALDDHRLLHLLSEVRQMIEDSIE
jgi:hypothetical protein